ncbi:MAG: ATP-binding protein [Micropruina sp.]
MPLEFDDLWIRWFGVRRPLGAPGAVQVAVERHPDGQVSGMLVAPEPVRQFRTAGIADAPRQRRQPGGFEGVGALLRLGDPMDQNNPRHHPSIAVSETVAFACRFILASTVVVMRRALVIASEYGAPEDERLGFVPEVAAGLAQALKDEWVVEGPVLNPTAREVKDTVLAAVAEAARGQQTLLLSFLGHGVVRERRYQPPAFYLQYRDSSHEPTSETSLHLVPFLSEVLGGSDAVGLNGLILLVDACSAGGVPIQAALDLDNPLGGRLEVLVASDDGNAYNGCFTKTITDALTTGIAHAGETIHPANVHPLLATVCATQSPAHLSYTNGYINLAGGHDPALWLLRNRTRAWHALLDRPDAGLLDQVAGQVSLSRSQKVALQRVKEHIYSRLRIVTGPAGSGKTTLLATLINPQRDRFGQVTASSISAAAFLSRITTPDAVIVEIADQLATVRGDQGDEQTPAFASAFAQARQQVDGEIKAKMLPGTTSLLDRELVLPLARSLDPTKEPVQIVLDGLDQVHSDQESPFLDLVTTLTQDDRLDRLRVIVGVRETDRALPERLTEHGLVTRIEPPTWGDVPDADRAPWLADVRAQNTTAIIDSGWLTVRLLEQLTDDPGTYDLATAARAFFTQALGRLANSVLRTITEDIAQLLGVTGIGPVLPLVVLKQALIELDHDITDADLGTIIATLGPLIIRGRAGFSDEHLGYAHLEIARSLAVTDPT